MTKALISQSAGKLNKILQNRYNITQSKVYQRLSTLSIKIHKNADEAWIESEELAALDDLDQFIKEGNAIKDYQSQKAGALTPSQTTIEMSHQEIIEAEELQAQQVTGNESALELIKQSAQSKAAGQLILQNLLTGQYLNNPELLAEQYKKAIAESETHAVPKGFDPTSYAQTALNRCYVSTGQ